MNFFPLPREELKRLTGSALDDQFMDRIEDARRNIHQQFSAYGYQILHPEIDPLAESEGERNEVIQPQPKRERLSSIDQELYQLIGRQEFVLKTDAELQRAFQRHAKKQLSLDYSVASQGFRARLYRIRRHHGLPLSAEIRKKRATAKA